MLDSMDRLDQKAYDMVTGEKARRAFDLKSEDEKLRDQYGRHTWGQSVLLARRLVEAGNHLRHRALWWLGPSLEPAERNGKLSPPRRPGRECSV